MSDIKKEVAEALVILSTLSVSGDAVDIMAAVRQKLKRALKMLDESQKEDTDG